jgi:3-oxoacyl-[acyl-carrier-protein] synthase II
MSSTSAGARRIVITGIGVNSPIGIGTAAFWDSLAAGRSGIRRVTTFEHIASPGCVGADIPDFNEESARKDYLKGQRKSLKVMCREIQLGVASALLALSDSRLDLESLDHERFGVDFGANLMFSPPDVLVDPCVQCLDPGDPDVAFHFDRWGRGGLPKMEPLWLLRYLPNMPACHIGIAADARGPSNSLTQDEASGNLSVGEAFRVLRRGQADVMIAGTTGTRMHPMKTIHAALLKDLAQGSGPPETWCRPFDKDRGGQVVGEGACSFLLESDEAARARGATIYGTVLGAGSSCVADRAGRADVRRALAQAMRAALRDAGLAPADVGHVNAHGISTRAGDAEEARALADVFGPLASRVPVIALKSYFGNPGASCGTLELAGSLLALRHDVLPVTLNYETPDPECPLDVVHGTPRPIANKVFLNVNVTRMGQASALVVSG